MSKSVETYDEIAQKVRDAVAKGSLQITLDTRTYVVGGGTKASVHLASCNTDFDTGRKRTEKIALLLSDTVHGVLEDVAKMIEPTVLWPEVYESVDGPGHFGGSTACAGCGTIREDRHLASCADDNALKNGVNRL